MNAISQLLVLHLAAQTPVTQIGIWIRAPGPDGDHDKEKKVQLTSMPQEEFTVTDIHYGRPEKFRGVDLKKVMGAFELPAQVDLMLLRFNNGMIIPLAPRDMTMWDKLQPRIALQIWGKDAAGKAGWQNQFPEIRKPGAEKRDVRPLQFQGNKVVVKSGWHPAVPAKAAEFSPWPHTDSLVGIELVKGDAYYRQFDAKGAEAGRKVFMERCQFCHGASGVGAAFGWDFVKPVPLYTYRDSKNLFLHTRYREGDAPEKGLMMPAFADITRGEAEAVWAWMKSVATEPRPEYDPNAK